MGTKVLTDDGEKPIGDRVLSKSDETGEVAYKEVVGLFQKQADEIYYIHIGDEIIEVTGEHPFWLDDKGWTFVSNLGIWVHNCALQNVYKSIKDSPLYPQGFSAARNGSVKNKVNNTDLLEELREIESGTWHKVYKDGLDANGNKISVHYFQSQSGQVFNVKTKNGWSNSSSYMP